MRVGLLACALLALAASARAPAATSPEGGPREDFLTGQFLIAAPEMGDPRFYHAVILIVHHDKDGALGIVVNRPVETRSLRRLLDDLGQPSRGASGTIKIFAGGPVQPNLGFILHSPEYKRAETLPIDRSVAVTSSPAVLKDIAQGRGPKKFIFAFGYAGWGPGQLEGELNQQAWFSAPDDPKLLFDDDRAKLWQDAIARRSRAL
jgi:putative transcriptional regulator